MLVIDLFFVTNKNCSLLFILSLFFTINENKNKVTPLIITRKTPKNGFLLMKNILI
jgi:hypothetical protein